MLTALSIRDIILIDRLDLTFESGLSALTGETGAGKSILLDALALALGGRGDAGLVRKGASQGQVIAVFDIASDHPARVLLREADVDSDGEAIILRRVQTGDGRTRGFVNDAPVSVHILRALGALLVEIHGQHDDRALVDPASHRALLDAFGGLQAHARLVRKLWSAWQKAIEALNEAQRRLAAIRSEADYLRHAHEELSLLNPEEDEESRLAARRQTMMAAEKISSDVHEAFDTLDGASSPLPLILALLRRMERRQETMPVILGPVTSALGSALDQLEEARSALDQAIRASEFDPKDLERTEERLFALRAAARKYNVPISALPAQAARFAEQLRHLDEGERDVTRLSAAAQAASEDYRQAAATLSKARNAAAARLDKAVKSELAPLKLGEARFLTRIESHADNPSADGIDQVAFWVQTNPGTHAGPLMKVASGGELSRFMLALKVVLADSGSAPTLVFDEIDSGVGGAVSAAIGERLARLADGVQVLTVTHAPQVAACADRHYLISKAATKGQTATRVAQLDDQARREEIARMLSGSSVTDEARAHAEKLMAGAR